MSKIDMKALSNALRTRLSTGSLPALPALEMPAPSSENDDEPSTVDAPAGGNDVLEQLARLGELREAGVLSEDEFADAKAQLLGRL
jgi:hypothetical protein